MLTLPKSIVGTNRSTIGYTIWLNGEKPGSRCLNLFENPHLITRLHCIPCYRSSDLLLHALTQHRSRACMYMFTEHLLSGQMTQEEILGPVPSSDRRCAGEFSACC